MLSHVFLVAALAAIGQCQISSKDVNQDLDAMSLKAYETHQDVSSIIPSNMSTTAPVMLNDLSDLVNLITTDTSIFKDSTSSSRSSSKPHPRDFVRRVASEESAYSPESQRSICTAYHYFAFVNSNLLKEIMHKSQVLGGTAYANQVLTDLTSFQSAADDLSNWIIDQVPDCSNDVCFNRDNLNSNFHNALVAYT